MAYISKIDDLSRRAFLRRSRQLAIAGTAGSFAMGLAGIGEAAAFNVGDNEDDYKALVCVFLYGGNDHNSTFIPVDDRNYDLYSAIRGGGPGRTARGLVPSQASLLATKLTPKDNRVLTNGVEYALAPQLPRLKALFDTNAMAPLLNVGTLNAPMTKNQFTNQAYLRPAKLFSHNDQQSTWQSSAPEGSSDGWGGRLGDLALARQCNTNSLFTCISATGNAVFVAGKNALVYQVAPNGAPAVDGILRPLFDSKAGSEALRVLMTQDRSNIFENEYNRVARRSIEAQTVVSGALAPITLKTSFQSPSGPNPLADQLKIVARLIAGRKALGVKRQVFMVSLAGFDTHNDQLDSHAQLMRRLDFALDAFYQATVELKIQNKVTTFTASDFGRTLKSNGDGTDHGWGSHHMIIGGAVDGGRYYGVAPRISTNSDDEVGSGRLLPGIAVDQYSATLARWFGASGETEIRSIAPNIDRFENKDLGFLI
ncbi:DUF1501 domain-containing protein [Sphingorhabdus sp.]|uniref:DUF1501 domain-containing protein n=1 Tax=Sphingorhabdus sp. TaxID=1902408 RepID=UPI00391C7CCC